MAPLGSVAYEIFPDRFASSGTGTGADDPALALRRDLDELPTGRGKDTKFELYGGDLAESRPGSTTLRSSAPTCST